eukprot:1157697-Pelagomonas_calceolata.AAC.2
MLPPSIHVTIMSSEVDGPWMLSQHTVPSAVPFDILLCRSPELPMHPHDIKAGSTTSSMSAASGSWGMVPAAGGSVMCMGGGPQHLTQVSQQSTSRPQHITQPFAGASCLPPREWLQAQHEEGLLFHPWLAATAAAAALAEASCLPMWELLQALHEEALLFHPWLAATAAAALRKGLMPSTEGNAPSLRGSAFSSITCCCVPLQRPRAFR